jgi:trigger factor
VERAVGRQGLIREALDKLVPDAYNEAIEAEDVQAIGQPELEIQELEPVRFLATVPVRPTVDLGDYKMIRVPREKDEVTPEMLDEQILLLRRRYATQVPVDRPAQWDDILTGDVGGKVAGDSFVADESAEFPLREGQTLFVPGLAESFLGMSRGDEKTIDLTMPDDFRSERLQGKQATFKLKVSEIKEEQLPEADDEFANQVNAEDFPTFDSLKARITTDLQKSLDEQADAKQRSEAVDRLVEGSTLEYPQLLVEREMDHLVRESMGNDQQQFVNYLRRLGRTEQEYRETLREAAETRVRRSLALSRLAEAEGLEVTAEEIEEELDTLVAPMGDDAARFRQMFATEDGVSTIRRNLISKKTLDRLAAIASGELEEEPA